MRGGSLASGLVLLLAFPAGAGAQTILNTERFQLDEVDGAHASGEISLSFRSGNAQVLDASVSGTAGTLAGRHWPRVFFGTRYLSTRKSSVLDAQFLQLRYSYVLAPAARTFHFLQAQKNETLLLRSRWLIGTGARTVLLASGRGALDLGTGLMGEWETLDPGRLGMDEDRRTATLRMANLLVFSWEADGGPEILNILYVQPDLSEFGDVRILNDLGLTAPVTERIGLTVSLEWRRDSRPPAALGKDDLRLSTSISFELT